MRAAKSETGIKITQISLSEPAKLRHAALEPRHACIDVLLSADLTGIERPQPVATRATAWLVGSRRLPSWARTCICIGRGSDGRIALHVVRDGSQLRRALSRGLHLPASSIDAGIRSIHLYRRTRILILQGACHSHMNLRRCCSCGCGRGDLSKGRNAAVRRRLEPRMVH